MPRKAKALTEASIRNAKPKEKSWKLFDGGGLYLEVTPAGGKLWRLKYRFGGKEKLLALGAWPEVSLGCSAATGRSPGAACPRNRPWSRAQS